MKDNEINVFNYLFEFIGQEKCVFLYVLFYYQYYQLLEILLFQKLLVDLF